MEKTYLITYITKENDVKYYTITCKIENIRNIFKSVVKEEGKFSHIENLDKICDKRGLINMPKVTLLALKEGLTRYIYFSKTKSRWTIKYSISPDYNILNILYNTKAKILYMKQSDLNRKEYYRNLIMDNFFIKEENLTDVIYNIKDSNNIINIKPLKGLSTSNEKIFLILDSSLSLNDFMSVFRDMSDIDNLVLLMIENDLVYNIYYTNNEIRIKKV